MKNNITIIHGADYHIRNREKNLFYSYEKSLKNITEVIKETKADIYVFAGDICDYAISNDSEKKLCYKHIADVLNIETLKELVFMLGNHDILSDKKQIDSNKDNNFFDTLNNFIENLTPELATKITYLKHQKQYISKVDNRLGWISYSLEDGLSNGNNINWELVDNSKNSKFNISIFHDIVRDYVDDSKLPVRKDKLDRLPYINDFKTELVLAGDIHVNYQKNSFNQETQTTTKFIYPGSGVQVNFGEGTYIKVRKNSTINLAAKKVLKKYNLNFENFENNVSYEIEDIELPSVISYITVDLNTNKIVDDFKNSITNLLNNDKLIWGENQTFIKIKLSSAYLQQELEIFKLIDEIASTKNTVFEIHTVYDKFVVSSDGSGIIEDIVVSDINDDSVNELTIDTLKLDNIKLNNLFDKVLNNHVSTLTKEIGDDALVKDIVENIKSLFAEQIDLSVDSTPNYNIYLNSVETNNFMNLGLNKINLNIPGLTRIKGTNGVGKTTLYNLIRWITDSMVFENLKSNQKVKNTLLVFNDKMFDNDSVIGRLNFHVNGTNVIATRSAFRKWKTNATEENKKSIEWRNYVAEVTQTLKVSVATKEGQKDFTGTEAETLLSRWFGNLTNTIMILNHHKILSMLNLPADKLQEMVLNYIGVDYLNSLKENLPGLKNQYNLQKPKTNIEDLRVDMLNQNNIKKSGKLELEYYDKNIVEIESLIAETKKLLEKYNTQHINFGNVTELLISTEKNITEQEAIITNFVEKEFLKIEEFTLTNPVEPDNSEKISISDNLEKQNIDFTEKINNDLLPEKQKYSDLLITTIKGDIDNTEILIKQEFVSRFDKLTITKNEKQLIFDNTFLEISNSYNATLNALRNKLDIKNNEISELSNEQTNLLIRNNKINTEIESGVCKECSRPFQFTADEFEEHKAMLISEKNDNDTKIQKIIEEINSLNLVKTKIDDFVKIYENLYIKSVAKVISYFVDVNVFNTLDENIKQQIKGLDLLQTEILTLDNYCSKLISLNLEYFEELKSSIVDFEILVINVKSLKAEIAFNQQIIDSINKNDLSYLKSIGELKPNNDLSYLKSVDELKANNDYNILISFIDSINIHQEMINSNKIKIDEIKTEIQTSKDNYIKSLNEYNTKLTEYQESVNKIQEENKVINEHNNSIIENKNKLIQLQNDKLTYQNNLPLYNQLLVDIEATKKIETEQLNKKVELNNLKVDLEKNLLLVDEKLNQINIEYNNYLEYQKHTHIYKLYDKLINKDFPDIVFDYYRQFLNNTLNILLEDMNFKLYWDRSKDLYMVSIKNGQATYRPVQLVSGMQTIFLGLSLIYAIHKLNIKNSISHIFIDEISGSLNSGKDLVEQKISGNDIVNYQEQLVLLLSKFNLKQIFIIDHVIDSLFESCTYNVLLNDNGTAIYKMEI